MLSCMLTFLTMSKTIPLKGKEDVESGVEETAARFIRHIEDFMRFRGITRAELARRMGVSRPVVTRLFTGSPNLTIRRMTAVAHALGCELILEVRRPKGPAIPRGLEMELRQPGNKE